MLILKTEKAKHVLISTVIVSFEAYFTPVITSLRYKPLCL